MQYRIGDKVKFLNDVGGGIITKLLGKNMVHVENEDGFEIPTLVSEIVLVGEQSASATNTASEKSTAKQPASAAEFIRQGTQAAPIKEEERKSTIQIAGNDQAKFYLAFVPENSYNPLDGTTKIYVVNDCNQTLLYNYLYFDGFQYNMQQWGEVSPNTKQIIGSLSSADIANLPEFAFQLMFFKEGASSLEQPLLKKIHVQSTKFYKAGSFQKNDFFQTPALLYKLHETAMEQAVEQLKVAIKKEPEPARVKRPETPKEWPELLEVDLHMHELVESEAGMTPKDMLDLQMKTFQDNIKGAIQSNKVKRVVFIHGIGEGVLKNAVRRELARNYKKYDFQDASFQEYGYGATMVILKR